MTDAAFAKLESDYKANRKNHVNEMYWAAVMARNGGIPRGYGHIARGYRNAMAEYEGVANAAIPYR